MSGKNKSNGASAEREFVISRVLDATRDRVYRAWTDPSVLSQWWGPRGYTNPVCETDLRPGGVWRITMRSPEGVEYPIKGVYREVVEGRRLVLVEDWKDHPVEFLETIRKAVGGNPTTEALNTVTFDEHGSKTKLTIRTHFETPAVRDAMVKMGMNDGWSQSLDRLEEQLVRMATKKESVR